jgi:hypothetical protein
MTVFCTVNTNSVCRKETSVQKDCQTRRVTSMKPTFCFSSDDPFNMHYLPPSPLNQEERNRQMPIELLIMTLATVNMPLLLLHQYCWINHCRCKSKRYHLYSSCMVHYRCRAKVTNADGNVRLSNVFISNFQEQKCRVKRYRETDYNRLKVVWFDWPPWPKGQADIK